MDNPEQENLASKAVEEQHEPISKVLIVRLVLAAAILGAFATFALQNTEKVRIEFLPWSFELGLFLVMVLSAIAGVVIWELASAYSRRAKRKRS